MTVTTYYLYKINQENPPTGHSQCEIYDEMRKYSKRWLSMADMTELLNIPQNIIEGTVKKMKKQGHLLFKDTGIKKRKKQKLTKGEFLKLYKEGKDDWEIAEETHVHFRTARKVRQRLNLPPISYLEELKKCKEATRIVLEILEGDE